MHQSKIISNKVSENNFDIKSLPHTHAIYRYRNVINDPEIRLKSNRKRFEAYIVARINCIIANTIL